MDIAEVLAEIQRQNSEAISTVGSYALGTLIAQGLADKEAVIEFFGKSENPILQEISTGIASGTGPVLRVIEGGLPDSPE